MKEYIEKKCPKCGQRLRFPIKVGGVLMECPSCGLKFHSDFRLGGVRKPASHEPLNYIFELPGNIVSRIIRYIFRKK